MEALDHRRGLGQLDLSLVEERAPVEAGGFLYELRVICRGLRASQRALHRPDVHPAEPAVQAQPPLLPEDDLLTTQEATQPVQRARQRLAGRVAFRVGLQRIHHELLAHAMARV
jgi:hypothetical protein